MNKFWALIAVAAGAVLAQPAQAVILNLDGIANASTDGSTGVGFALAAGRYRVSFVIDQYTAFSRFSAVTGCDGSGSNCVQGFENSAMIVLNGVTSAFGDGNASGGFGPISGGGYYDTAANAFANSGKYQGFFTAAGPVTGSAYIFDDILSDNRGGISLNISPVPEPATWGLMILGFGGVGVAMRRRSANTVVA